MQWNRYLEIFVPNQYCTCRSHGYTCLAVIWLHAASIFMHLFQTSASEYHKYSQKKVKPHREVGEFKDFMEHAFMTIPHIPAEETEAFSLCIYLMQYVQQLLRATACSTHTMTLPQQVSYLETYLRNC